jgi:hypothetical protein
MNSPNDRGQHIAIFYDLLSELETILGGKKLLKDCNGRMNWPRRGVYFFFEKGEMRKLYPSVMRVVRVGTHAVSRGSRSTLWGRLSTHRGTNQGTGNHRASVFRRHVGVALIARSQGALKVPTWGEHQSAPRTVREKEADLERQVSAYIGQMPLLWLAVDDEPGTQSDRSVIEANAIALLAGRDGQSPADPPSVAWLGNYHSQERIRLSGLWNLDYVGTPGKLFTYDPAFLELMAKYIRTQQ